MLNLERMRIEQTVDKLLNTIEKYNSLYPQGDERRIDYGPVDISKIRNFADYPYDYQYFVSKIGSLSYSPGYAGLSVKSEHIALKDIHPDEFGEYLNCEFLEMEMNVRYENEGETIADWAKKEGIAEHILVAEDPCSYSYLAFDPSASPYTPTDVIEKQIYPSFVAYVNDHLSIPFAEVDADE